MRFKIALLALCLISSSGLAEECRIISDSTARLACYDRQFPVTKAEKASKQKTKDQGKIVDRLAEENARLTKKIRSICRGC